MNYWLLKTEPGTYSFSDLQKDKKTNWNGIRNYQARNFLRQAGKNDLALIYHSGDDKSVVGIARIVSDAYPDVDRDDPKAEWVQVDLTPVKPLKEPVALKTIKATAALKTLLLVKNSRISVMPVSPAHYEAILKLGGLG